MKLPENLRMDVYRRAENYIVVISVLGKDKLVTETFETTISYRGMTDPAYFERDVRRLTKNVEHYFDGRPKSGYLSDHYIKVHNILIAVAKSKFSFAHPA